MSPKWIKSDFGHSSKDKADRCKIRRRPLVCKGGWVCTRQQHTPSVFYSYSEEDPTLDEILSIGAVGETLPGRCAFQTPNNSSPKWRGCAADVHWGTLRGDFADSGEISTASVDGNTRRLAVARMPSIFGPTTVGASECVILQRGNRIPSPYRRAVQQQPRNIVSQGILFGRGFLSIAPQICKEGQHNTEDNEARTRDEENKTESEETQRTPKAEQRRDDERKPPCKPKM